MDNIVSVKLDSRYASTLGVWQYDYGQVLRITGPELPPAVEVQFSLDEKSGETLSRVGTTVDGVTEVKIPDELLTHSATSNYRIYVYIYLTDETSGNTKYEITIPVRVRSKPTSPTKDPETDPDLFRETVVAVNALAERAENAASSATESAASAEETLIEIKRVTDGISEDIENANTAKSELSGMIDSAEKKKKELVASTEEAGETKTELDSSIRSAEKKQLALDTTVKQANAADASLKEQIGSAEQIQANVKQIGKNTQAISSLNEDLSNKITKFYASNQGETHLADSDNGKIMDMMLYGKSEQFTATGKNLLKIGDGVQTTRGVTVITKDGVVALKGTATETGWTLIDTDSLVLDGMYILSSNITGIIVKAVNKQYKEVLEQNKSKTLENAEVSRIAFIVKRGETYDVSNILIQIEKGSEATSYEPYTGGIPSPNPDYPQEIKRVVNPVVKVCGKNLWNPIAGGYISNLNGSITASEKSDIATTDFIKTNGKDITVIVRNFSLAIEYAFAYRIGFYDAEKKWIKNVVLSDGNKHSINTFNVTDAEYIRVSAPSGVYDTIQIEKGSEATSYEPYTEQSVQLPYTLNAIPVASGGNVTIDGQQYIADRVVEKNGVFGIERNTATDVPVLTKKLRETPDVKGRFIQDGALKKTFTPFYTPLVNIGYSRNWGGVAGNVIDKWIFGVDKVNFYISPPKDLNYTSEDIFNALKDLNIKVYGALLVPFFEPLPGDIQAKLRTLVTNYPVTNISVTSDQLDGYTVFNYPISMANGWNYVKQQLGDTRDYIYDMDAKAQDIDIQSAEAYVNSEYAVALAELEV